MAKRKNTSGSNNRFSEGNSGNEKKAVGALDWFRISKDKPDDIASSIQMACQNLSFTQLGIQQRNFRNAVLYGGYGYVTGMRYSGAVMPAGGMMNAAVTSQGRMGPALNIINSIINTIMSRILAAGEPAVSFVTKRGDFELQHKAELLEQYCEGLFDQVDFSRTSRKILQDCLIFGTGCLKISSDANDNLLAERVFPNELWVEAWDGREGKPRTVFQVGTMDRDVLANKYPKFKEQIMDVRSMHPMDQSIATSVYTNVIPVWEAWHLPSPKTAGKEPDDGRHVICIADEHVILDEPWEDDDFPFVFLRFSDVPEGFWGLGVSELLWGFQNSLNNAVQMEYYAQQQMSIPRIYMQVDSDTNENSMLAPKSGLVMTGHGPAPVALNFQATTQNFVEYKNWLTTWAYQFIGVSLMQASGVKPDGMDSGAAIRDYNETADMRFSLLSQRLGNYYVEAARKLICEAARIYSKTKSYTVNVKGKTFVDSIDWKDIDLDRDEYSLQLFDTSALPRSPAGRLNMVQDLLKANMLTPDEGRKLLSFPDLDEVLDLENAQEMDAEWYVYKILHTTEFPTPDPLSNLALCATTMQKALLIAKHNNAPVTVINKGRKWLQMCKSILIPKPTPVQAPPAPGALPPGAPQAKPAPPPVSQLIPNQPKPNGQQ